MSFALPEWNPLAQEDGADASKLYRGLFRDSSISMKELLVSNHFSAQSAFSHHFFTKSASRNRYDFDIPSFRSTSETFFP